MIMKDISLMVKGLFGGKVKLIVWTNLIVRWQMNANKEIKSVSMDLIGGYNFKSLCSPIS